MMNRLLAVLTLLFSLSITPAFADLYDEADKAHEAGDYEKAKSILLPLADAGNADAMNLIGFMYDEDKAFSKNEKLACDWYEKAALAGQRYAQYNLALCFEEGVGRNWDIANAIYWAEKSAEQGVVDAQISLIDLLAQKDRDKAMYWGQKAVDQGSALARATMWSHDLQYKGPQASPADIACVLVMNGLFDKDWSYCD